MSFLSLLRLSVRRPRSSRLIRCSACFHGSHLPVLTQRNKEQDPILAIYRGGARVTRDAKGLAPCLRGCWHCWFLAGARPTPAGHSLTPCVHTWAMQPSPVCALHATLPAPSVLWHADSGVVLRPPCAWMGHMTRSGHSVVGTSDVCHSRCDTPRLPPATGTGTGHSPGAGCSASRGCCGTTGRRAPVLHGAHGGKEGAWFPGSHSEAIVI